MHEKPTRVRYLCQKIIFAQSKSHQTLLEPYFLMIFHQISKQFPNIHTNFAHKNK